MVFPLIIMNVKHIFRSHFHVITVKEKTIFLSLENSFGQIVSSSENYYKFIEYFF